jgi:hypothetical protein
MVLRSSALTILPSTGSMPRRPLPFPGSLWARFPGLIGTMERSDFLPPIPGGSLIARRYRPCAPCFAPAAGEHYLRRAWVLVSRLPYRLFQVRRQQDLPSSRQILSMHALLTSDPGGTGALGHSALTILPSAPGTASAPTNSRFRGSITRPASSLSTLRSGGYPNATQDSLPGGDQPYPGGTRPAGSVRKVSD